ncbi:MAG: HAD family hydrolase [Tissierellia bacterium]|nr:HAD family hydrolase [Tissierellia bacterium]
MTYILFDLDGTLSDNSVGIQGGVVRALERFGRKVREEDLWRYIGPPILDSFQKYDGLTLDEAQEGIGYYREYYQEKGIYENILYDGIIEVLENLHGADYRLVVATAKPEPFAKAILEKFGVAHFFEGIYGASMDNSRIHKEDVIEYCLREQGISAEDAVMIGDREHDILGAKTHGLRSIGVLYGFGSREELESAGADEIVMLPKDIPQAIQKVFS